MAAASRLRGAGIRFCVAVSGILPGGSGAGWRTYAGYSGRGEGLLSVDTALWPTYRDALAEGGHPASAARMAGGLSAWVSEDPEADWPVVSEHLAQQMNSYRRYMVEGTGQPIPRPVDPERMRNEDPAKGSLRSFMLGTPEELATRIRASIGEAPVETVYLWASIAGMTEDVVAAHVRTICTRLAPLLADDE